MPPSGFAPCGFVAGVETRRLEAKHGGSLVRMLFNRTGLKYSPEAI
jgi:hypothetical protein